LVADAAFFFDAAFFLGADAVFFLDADADAVFFLDADAVFFLGADATFFLEALGADAVFFLEALGADAVFFFGADFCMPTRTTPSRFRVELVFGLCSSRLSGPPIPNPGAPCPK
jgi:hypothetical protein